VEAIAFSGKVERVFGNSLGFKRGVRQNFRSVVEKMSEMFFCIANRPIRDCEPIDFGAI
jgi:hypothetical protein